MLTVLTLLIVLVVGYAYFNEGFFTAGLMFCNVLVAGLLTFNFFEPLASALQSALSATVLEEYVDFASLVGLFCLFMAGLRWATHSLSPTAIEYNGWLTSMGGAFFGIVTGYLVAGFLTCVVQTLPLHESFLGFSAKADSGDMVRRLLPPDRVWLALMSRAGAYGLSNNPDPNSPQDINDLNYRKYVTFDKYGTFEARYARYRRYNDRRNPLPYGGELSRQLHQ